MLRVVGAGVCHFWYSHSADDIEREVEMEEVEEVEMEDEKITITSEQCAKEPRDLLHNPTLAYLKQALTTSFESVVLAALLAMDCRGFRAILGSIQYTMPLPYSSRRLIILINIFLVDQTGTSVHVRSVD